MKKFLVMAGLAALASVGCIKLDKEVTLNADGSADLKLHYAMSEQVAAQMEAMKQMAKKDPNMKVESTGPDLSFDEAGVKAALEKKEGVKVKSVKVETKDGWKHVYADMHCDDLAKAMTADLASNKGDGLSLTKNADGNWVMEVISKNEDEKKPSPEEQAMVKTMMAGLSISIKVNVPGDIVETTAPAKDKRSATWALDIADEKFFDKSEEFNKKGMKVTFKGEGLKLKEFKPPAPEKAPAGEKPGAGKKAPEPEAGGGN